MTICAATINPTEEEATEAAWAAIRAARRALDAGRYRLAAHSLDRADRAIGAMNAAAASEPYYAADALREHLAEVA